MKKIYLTILSALTCGLANAQSPQISNSGFESWTSSKKATSWTSSNDFISVLGAQNVYQETTDKVSGTYAIKMTTISGSPFVSKIPGLVSNGTYTGNLADFSVDKIVPIPWDYPERPDSLTAYLKYTPTGNDSATISCQFYKNSSVLGQSLFQVGYSTGNFIRISSEIVWDSGQPTSVIPDSMLIIISSSAIIEANQSINSSLIVDNIGFSGLTSIKSVRSNFVKLVPNPAKNQISIKGLNSIKTEVRVYNTLGSEVLKTTTQNGLIEIDKLNPGVYFLEAINEKDKVTQRFVKE